MELLHIQDVYDGRGRLHLLFKRLIIKKLIIEDSLLGRNLRKRRGNSIPSSAFVNSTVLMIELSNVQLQRVPTRALAKIKHLQSVKLSKNLISTVRRKELYKIRHVSHLDLTGNQLRKIPSKALRYMTNLQTLIISENRISNITDKDLASNVKLTTLDIGSNNLHTISNNAFANNDRLAHLSIAFNRFPSENYDLSTAVGALKHLINLDIGGTQISISSFRSNSLTVLTLKEQKGAHLGDVSRFNQLQKLDLSGCEQMRVPVNWTMHHVQQVDLSRTAVPLKFIRVFPSLTHLFVDRHSSAIQTLHPNQFKANALLTHIQLDSCQINKISADSFNYLEKSLKVLSLRKNELASLDLNTFSRLQSLQEIDLSSNKFRDVFGLNLFPLDFELFVGSSRTLQHLNLAKNYLEILPVNLLKNLHNLKTLNLAANNIRQISADICLNKQHLESVNLFNNRISMVLPQAFVKCTKLKELNLAMNPLMRSVDYVRYPPSIQNIILRNTHLETVDRANFNELPNLKYLDLSMNLIRMMSPDSLAQSAQSVTYIDLGENPLDCTCPMRAFVEWLSEYKISLSPSTVCSQPAILRHQHLIRRVCWSRCKHPNTDVDFCASDMRWRN